MMGATHARRGDNSAATSGRIGKCSNRSRSAGLLASCAVAFLILPPPGERLAAQSAGMFVNAGDLDIVRPSVKISSPRSRSTARHRKRTGVPPIRYFLPRERSEPFLPLRSLRHRDRLEGAPRNGAFQEIRGHLRQNGRQARRPADVGDRRQRDGEIADPVDLCVAGLSLPVGAFSGLRGPESSWNGASPHLARGPARASGRDSRRTR
jgi:hypothetical protein